jgi:pilus assembly protein CpaB
MKWSLLGLLFLGLVAAACVTAMVLSMQASAKPVQAAAPLVQTDPPPEPVDPDVQVLTAAGDLEPRHVLEAGDIAVATMPASVAPEGALAEPVQGIGKVLLVPVKRGQALVARCFAEEGSGVHLASTLLAGKRAVSIALSDPMGMEALLDPGCIVDVLATMKAHDEVDDRDMPISVTLLEGIRVLAIGGRTIFSSDTPADDSSERNDRPTVTLLVEPEEAEMLKLAMEEGSVSLSMRNPMDASSTAGEGTRLTQLSPILAEADRRARELWLEEQRLAREQLEYERQRVDRDRQAVEKAASEIEQTTPYWETIFLRGSKAETKQFTNDADAAEPRRKPARPIE